MKLPIVLISMMLISCTTNDDVYLKDLFFIHKAISENHPGVFNGEDPNFNNRLTRGYHAAKKKLMQSGSDSKKKNIITNFLQSFQDKH
jgi:hypothetical protein